MDKLRLNEHVSAKTLGQAIEASRKARNLDQHELAAALGVSQQTISLWESGRGRPVAKRIDHVIEFFGTESEVGRLEAKYGRDRMVRQKKGETMRALFEKYSTTLEQAPGETDEQFQRAKNAIDVFGDTVRRYNDIDDLNEPGSPEERRVALVESIMALVPEHRTNFDRDLRDTPVRAILDYASEKLVVEVLLPEATAHRVASAALMLAAARSQARVYATAEMLICRITDKPFARHTEHERATRQRAALLGVEVKDFPDAKAVAEYIRDAETPADK